MSDDWDSTDRGEGAPSPGDASADGSGDTSPAGPSGVRFPHAPSPHRDPAASAPLSELVTVNQATNEYRRCSHDRCKSEGGGLWVAWHERLPHVRCECGWVGVNLSQHKGAHPISYLPEFEVLPPYTRELVAVNIAGDIEAVADMLRSHPLAQARLRRIAEAIRDRGLDGGPSSPPPSSPDPDPKEEG